MFQSGVVTVLFVALQAAGITLAGAPIRVVFKPDPVEILDPAVTPKAPPPPPTNEFGMDLLSAIHDLTGLVFQTTFRSDLAYGAPINGSFTGTLLAPLINNEADLTGPELVVTSYGEQVVDFLVPINSFKLRILYNTELGLTDKTQYTVANTEDLIYLNTTTNVDAQAVWQDIVAGKPDSILPADETGEDMILGGNIAVVAASHYIGQILEYGEGKISVATGDLGGPFFLSMAVQKGSSLREVLNTAILQLSENGMLEQLLKKHELWSQS
ncbi:hypothetical protein BV898_15922 [Hypsibius exemplaris]|uniref:Ionotropic glutamate receptor L-glutamate and glycine-binding domain-containing protein n=1 Tax=Hypsibius exemplaris TaxID=2072580 RepID=A0A9X6RL74_HYPEX|nr:hypothetical protein BV898_15922 [Hypsibius exemplaris]